MDLLDLLWTIKHPEIDTRRLTCWTFWLGTVEQKTKLPAPSSPPAKFDVFAPLLQVVTAAVAVQPATPGFSWCCNTVMAGFSWEKTRRGNYMDLYIDMIYVICHPIWFHFSSIWHRQQYIVPIHTWTHLSVASQLIVSCTAKSLRLFIKDVAPFEPWPKNQDCGVRVCLISPMVCSAVKNDDEKNRKSKGWSDIQY